jgi:hypothetical protein
LGETTLLCDTAYAKALGLELSDQSFSTYRSAT